MEKHIPFRLMALFAILALTFALLSCSEDDEQPKDLSAEWYFESMFPLNVRFTVTPAGPNFIVQDAVVVYHNISESDSKKTVGELINGDNTGFANVNISGPGYELTLTGGVIRQEDPRFMDVQALVFTDQQGETTTLNSVVLKRLK